MSLLASLIQASGRFQQAMDSRQSAKAINEQPQASDTKAPEATGTPGDDRFTPSGRDLDAEGSQKTQKLSMADYKQTIAQDLSHVRETLRHKLAEYNLNPSTALNVSKGEDGRTRVEGTLSEADRIRIEQDLNNNRSFQASFSRLSTNEPTLHFVDNALKLNQAYGVNNSLLDALVSENQQFNGLQDLVHRYDNLKRSAGDTEISAEDARRYAFNLNTRA